MHQQRREQPEGGRQNGRMMRPRLSRGGRRAERSPTVAVPWLDEPEKHDYAVGLPTAAGPTEDDGE